MTNIYLRDISSDDDEYDFNESLQTGKPYSIRLSLFLYNLGQKIIYSVKDNSDWRKQKLDKI